MSLETELDWEPIFNRIWLQVRKIEDALQRACDEFEKQNWEMVGATYIENQMNRARHQTEKLIWSLRELPGGDFLGDATRPGNSPGP